MSETLILPKELSDNYQLIRQIGEGANGITWLAQTLDRREVAIKSLRLSVSEDLKSFELFKREAEALKYLDVDGVPKFYQSVISNENGGACFIVQEYIKAPSLLQLIKERKQFSEAETLDVMLSVAKILQSLHGDYVPPVIHRDIKPSNILCQIDPISHEWKTWLIDFGAVANPETRRGGSTIAGTHGYMAPEQLLGECSIASDFYALGACAVEMLTGIEPWRMESDGFQLKYENVMKEHAPNTSKEMMKLLEILLAPKAEERPDNALILQKMILQVKMGESPSSADESKVKKASKPGIFARIFRRNTKKSMTAGANWVIVPGMIRCVKKEMVFYTFTTKKGEFMEGVDSVFQTTYDKFPVECKVWYNPKQPMFNELLDS